MRSTGYCVVFGLVPEESCAAIRFMKAALIRSRNPGTSAVNMITTLIENSLRLALDSAPWLLFGLIAAGLIHAWMPMQAVGRALGGSGPMAVIKAALIGAPLPLCSCGTLAAYLFGVCGVSVLLGLSLDGVINAYGIDILSGSSLTGDVTYEPPAVLASLSLLLLVVCGIRPLRRFISNGKGGDGGGCCG